MSEIVIASKNVSKHFGEGEAQVHALREVDLDINIGDFAAIVGPSGSGKTTLLNIGLVFQAYNLIPVLTVLENIEYVMLLQNVPVAERKERVEKFLTEVGLEGKGNRFPVELSGGQQQRVAIARAMVSHPDIILADEPTANLDSETGVLLLDMMRKFNEEFQMTFVFSTHDPQIMERAKRMVTLTDGHIVSDEIK